MSITHRDAPAQHPSCLLVVTTLAPAVMFFLALAGCAVNLVNLFVLDSHVGHSHGPGEGHGCGGHGHSHAAGEPEHDHSHSMQGAQPHSSCPIRVPAPRHAVLSSGGMKGM